MPDPQTLSALIQNRLDEFLSTRTSILARVSPETAALSSFSRNFLSGGKRFRARFCVKGWQSVVGEEREPSGTVLSAASALEVFHAAALVHDDIIDRSDTRRGALSAHRRFESEHVDARWSGDARDYGRAAAILLGDLLLGWSDELLDEGLDREEPDRRRSVRAEFMRMRTEVTAGQYLDILEEQAWSTHGDADHLTRAETVAMYKSAKYSVESPLALGALIAGGSEAQLSALRGYGAPLGMAYQMRDDVLGVFGDSRITGKPSGDDLREGKRTVLIALTRTRLGAADRSRLDQLLGDPTLTAADIDRLQDMIRATGAVAQLEARIADAVGEAKEAVGDADLDPRAVASLRALADAVANRES